MADLYHRVYSDQVKAKLKHLHRQAQDAGHGETFLRLLQEIDEILSAKAHEFGEPLYELVHVEVRHAVHESLVVYWAVHDDAKKVFLKDYRLLPFPPQNHQ